MAQNVADFFWSRLHEWGVRCVFGYPGDGINGLLGGLQRLGEDKIRFIQVRHEEMAAFMASAYAKFTGELGVCLATSGPGASHLITGLYDARLDHMPVLAIAGQQARTAVGGHYQQELDLVSMYKDVAGAFVYQASMPAQVRHLVDRAVRIAVGERRVTALVIPNDLQEEPYTSPPRKHGTVHSGVGYAAPKVVPYDADLRRAAEVLNAGKRVAILVGAGALGATDVVIAVAERLGAGVAKALLGKGAMPDDLPWVTGSIGMLGTKPSWEMMVDCDTLLMIGSGFPYSEFLPKEGSARGVQIDIDPGMLSIRYPMEVNLVGDSTETLRALLPLLLQKKDDSWRRKIEKNVATWWRDMEARAHASANPVNPQRVAWELSPLLPEHAIITSDSGSCANWYARDLKIRRGMMCSLSGGLASMGAAVPYAIAAKFAHPDRPVIALVGDGAMQMNNMAELITVTKYWREWADPRWVVCVFNNQDLNQVTWEQRVMNGNPKFEATQKIPDVPYHRFADLIGLRGLYVDTPERMASAWEEALTSDRPVVLEVKTDPEVPPLPPHITLDQARKFTSALVKGDPDEGKRAAWNRQGGAGIGAPRTRLRRKVARAVVRREQTLARLCDELDRLRRTPPLLAEEVGATRRERVRLTPALSVIRSPTNGRADGATIRAARRLNRATGILASSVLFDSAVEHYRGSFNNPAMIVPLIVSALTLGVSAHGTADTRPAAHRARQAVYATGAVAGLLGTGFHVYNVLKRPGAPAWQNLFYGAPVGAPMALLLAGLLGSAAEVVRENPPHRARVLGLPAGRLLSAVTGLGLLGTTAEAALLHFRGAFHDPVMFAPVTIPPAGGTLLLHAAYGAKNRNRRLARWWLRLVAWLGVAGMGFHAWGVQRNMGGWRNWRQNLLNGPPIPAPPSFLGLALAGLAALGLLDVHPDG